MSAALSPRERRHHSDRRRADTLVVGGAVAGVVLTSLLIASDPGDPPEVPVGLGLVIGLVLAFALGWRRRASTVLVVVAVLTSPIGAAVVPQLVALFGFARSRPRAGWGAGAAMVLGSVLPSVVRAGWTESTATQVAFTVALVGSVLAAAITSARDESRSAMDWLADFGVYLFVWLVNLIVLAVGLDEGAIDVAPALARDLLAVTALTVALWFRRDWPVPIALAGLAVAPFAQFGLGAFLLAAFTVTAREPVWKALAIAGAYVAATVLHVALVPETGISPAVGALLAGLAYGGVVGWGMVARSRRQLVDSLRERARQAESEQELRLDRARRTERERIAREMHDVLAHRLSLLSVHAGALEYRPDAPPSEIGAAAAVIRESSHRALEDLRDVIGVLRDGAESGPPETPQPTLADLDALVGEATNVGVTITADVDVDPTSVPERIARTAYRIVQEALTNARKHAPTAPVAVQITGAAGDGLVVEIGNPVTKTWGADPSGIPGARAGLVGLRERVHLVGGTFSSGVGADDRFVVRARLPWPS